MYRGGIRSDDDVPHGKDGGEDRSAGAGGAEARNGHGASAELQMDDVVDKEERR